MSNFSFSNIPGNDKVKASFRLSVINQRVSHTQMIAGPESAPVLPLAFAYAKYLLCQDPGTEESCGTCKSCIQFEKGAHPDFHLSFPYHVKSDDSDEVVNQLHGPLARRFFEMVLENVYLSQNRWAEELSLENKIFEIKTKEASRLIRKLNLKSYQGGRTVLILWLPEILNTTAANKLLKMIEEPPANAVFLLVSHNPKEVLPTISSRSQITYIQPHTKEEIKSYLVHRLGIDERVSTKLANNYPENISAAIFASNHQDEIGENIGLFATWMRFCFKADVPALIGLTDELSKRDKHSLTNFFTNALDLIRRSNASAIFPNESDTLIPENIDFQLSKFSKVLTLERTILLSEIIEDAIRGIEGSANKKLVILDTSILVSRALRS
jgi:DNA polymerase-3 subunit delta'